MELKKITKKNVKAFFDLFFFVVHGLLLFPFVFRTFFCATLAARFFSLSRQNLNCVHACAHQIRGDHYHRVRSKRGPLKAFFYSFRLVSVSSTNTHTHRSRFFFNYYLFRFCYCCCFLFVRGIFALWQHFSYTL